MPFNRTSPSLTIHIPGSTTSLASNSSSESSKSTLKAFGITTFSQRRRQQTQLISSPSSPSSPSSTSSTSSLSTNNNSSNKVISRFKERFSMVFLASSNNNLGQVVDQIQDQDQNVNNSSNSTSFVDFLSSSKQDKEKYVRRSMHRKASILSSNHSMMDSPIAGTFISISEFGNLSSSTSIHQSQDQDQYQERPYSTVSLPFVSRSESTRSSRTYPTSSSSTTIRPKGVLAEEVQLPRKLLLPIIAKRSYICPWETISPSSTLFHSQQNISTTLLDLEKQLPSTSLTTRILNFSTNLRLPPLFTILLFISLILIVINLLVIDIQYLPFINTNILSSPLTNQIYPTSTINQFDNGITTKSFLEPFPVLTTTMSSTIKVKSIRESITFVPVTASTSLPISID